MFNNFTITQGNKVILKKEITIPEYTAIAFSVPGQVIYRQTPGNNAYLEITTDENILPLLDIRVNNKCLMIKTKNYENISPSQLVIYTNSSQLENIKLSGSGKVWVAGEVKAETMGIVISGSGKLEAEALQVERSDVKISGSGSILLKGTGKELSCLVSGSGDIYSDEFIARKVCCKVSGSGNVRVYAGEELTARVSGSGDIRYKGNPTITTIKKSGSGSIKPIQ